jgi:hypothetical protein
MAASRDFRLVSALPHLQLFPPSPAAALCPNLVAHRTPLRSNATVIEGPCRIKRHSAAGVPLGNDQGHHRQGR